MLTALLFILLFALVLVLLYYILGIFIQGTPLKVIGAILAVILLIVALQKLGLAGGLNL